MTDMQLGKIRRRLKLSPEKLSEGLLREFRRTTIPPSRIRRLETGGVRFLRQEQDLLRLFFGKKFIELSEKPGLSLREIADRVDIPHSTVGRWEQSYRAHKSRK